MRPAGGKKNLTLSQQFILLQTSPIAKGRGSIQRGKLVWQICACPTPLSRIYSVRIEYKLGGSPDVFVEDPDLYLLGEGRKIPHVYHDPLRLCLYLPGTGQWHPKKPISQTIVPWIYTWLYYFEDWLAFGVWNGGGKHSEDESELTRNRRMRRSLACS